MLVLFADLKERCPFDRPPGPALAGRDLGCLIQAFVRQNILTMQTRMSSKGQIVLPGAIRRRLGPRPGDPLDASVKSGQIVLTPRHSRPAK